MDLATILGLTAGFAMVIAAMISGGDALPYMHLPSMLITFGGTMSAVLIHFPVKRVQNSLAVARNCFVTTLPSPADVISRFRTFAITARREGLLALEKVAADDADAFVRTGLELTASGCDAPTLRAALQRELEAIEQRHLTGRRLFEVMGSAAPAWGMTGTLIGLIQMLRHLDDPRQIGAGLAMALLTTLYGALFANLVCIPLAGKLEARHAEEVMIRQVMTEGFMALHEEHAPGLIEERLRAWVPPHERVQPADSESRAA